MEFPRSSGILLHPTSLPGPYGSGTLGREARRWVRFIAGAGQTYWQILPLGPTGYGDSPYQSLSSFAGNPYLIDPDTLVREGLASGREAEACESPDTGKVDFGTLFRVRNRFLDLVWERYNSRPQPGLARKFAKFKDANDYWLDDFALFCAIKEEQNHAAWSEWPEEYRVRDPSALSRFRERHGDRIGRHEFVQFLFFRQWGAIKAYANGLGLKIVGDVPIFVAYDSADTWSHPELFQLDSERRPLKVAGVPPDYFTATGQLWGNPLYDWAVHKADGYAWWAARIGAALGAADILRIDHFRGFEAYWAVPAQDETAERGAWEKGPGLDFFTCLAGKLGDLPIIAEDLGFMNEEVHRIRDGMGFPGMKILQFAFEPGEENGDLPHTYTQNCAVYTGTHDNDTSRGWLASAAPEARARALAYLPARESTFHWDMIRGAWASPARIAITPAQDLLGLGSESRMNYPGKQGGYWTWRLSEGLPKGRVARRLKALTTTYYRSRPQP